MASADRRISHHIQGLHASDDPLAPKSNRLHFNPASRPAIRGRGVVHEGIRGRHLSHDAHYRLLQFYACSQRFRPPRDFHITLAPTYDDVPMWVLDRPLANKIHTPSVALSGPRCYWLSSAHHTQKHPLVADVFLPNGTAEPVHCWLLLV